MAKDLNSAVLALQGEIGTLQKNALNPHFKSKYLSLDALVEHVQPLLTRHGLIWTTRPTSDEVTNAPALGYSLIHAESGQLMTDIMPLLLEKQNAQGLGSAITYARRYALCAVLNIVADVDDDGEKAAKQKAAPKSAETFADRLRATGRKGAEVRKYLADNGATLDDVGITGPEFTQFLNGLTKPVQDNLLFWAKSTKDD